jgi:hypothetical protein
MDINKSNISIENKLLIRFVLDFSKKELETVMYSTNQSLRIDLGYSERALFGGTTID